MQLYNALAILTVLAALFSYINYRFIRLPDTIGMMLISVGVSLCVLLLGRFDLVFFEGATRFIRSIDFHTVLVKMMLSFLLFAGAIHFHFQDLRRERISILTFSTLSVLISTLVVGGTLFWLCRLFQQPMEFIYCLLFGALISPTDPIAALSILRQAGIPRSLEVKITGESLFNDGVGIVLFLVFYQIASPDMENLSAIDAVLLLLRQAGGGVLLGVLLGYLGYWLLRSIDYYQVEVMITLAIVMGGYLLADELGLSGPLAMVVAGIITGNKSRLQTMSDTTRDYLDKFWELVDNLLNAVLFLLIGLQMLVIPLRTGLVLLGLATIPLVMVARYISVALPIGVMKSFTGFEKNAVGILTWGGLRGGLSVALALSLPGEMHGDLFVTITYVVVLFSILVQGLTIGPYARRVKTSKKALPCGRAED